MAWARRQADVAAQRPLPARGARLVLSASDGSCPGTISLLLALALGWIGTASSAEFATARPVVDPPTATGHEAPRVVFVEPARVGSLLVCNVATAGLPGEKLALSMQSGLVSAIELQLDVLDARRRIVAANRITFRLAFDLWEEIFAVEWNGGATRLADMMALQALLADLRALPVAPLANLAPEGRFLVRAGLALHPVALSEKERVGSAIGAAPPPADRAGGRQEATVSLSRLIRLFYHGTGERPDLAGAAESAWFVPRELAAAKERPDAPN